MLAAMALSAFAYLRAALVSALVLLLGLSTTASADTWPMFHHDHGHSGLSADTAIGAASAHTLGVGWEQNLGDATYASPIVGHVASINRDLVFVGNNAGVMSAYDDHSGARRWWHATGAAINSTAAYASGRLWFGSSDHNLYALNAATGAEACHFDAGGVVSSSPTLGNPDGKGQVVYFGDNGLSGADDGGAFYAVNASDCSRKWGFTSFGSPPGSQPLVGSWSPPAFATLASGRTVVVFGSSSPEGAVYCLDATTGKLLWRFPTLQITHDQDVGAGPTVSDPGVNGYSAGAVYVAGKDNVI
jgi:outer membrane protein assembly factor BamB